MSLVLLGLACKAFVARAYQLDVDIDPYNEDTVELELVDILGHCGGVGVVVDAAVGLVVDAGVGLVVDAAVGLVVDAAVGVVVDAGVGLVVGLVVDVVV